MADLDVRIRERLASYSCCEGYINPGLDRARAAVLAAIGCHPNIPTGIATSPFARPRLLTVCNTCNESYPCREVRFIAVALGIEVDDGGSEEWAPSPTAGES